MLIKQEVSDIIAARKKYQNWLVSTKTRIITFRTEDNKKTQLNHFKGLKYKGTALRTVRQLQQRFTTRHYVKSYPEKPTAGFPFYHRQM